MHPILPITLFPDYLFCSYTRYNDKVSYQYPTGELLLREILTIAYPPYPPFSVTLQIYRAESPLTQTGEDREGGLLVTDEFGTVLDLTLLRYDQDENAARLFGSVQIECFRDLLANEELVLSDTRDGLNLFHPFCEALKDAVESRLRPIIELEKERDRQSKEKLSNKQRQRLSYSVDQINKLLERLTNQVWSSGGSIGDETKPPPGGLEFRPHEVKLLEGKETRVRLRIDTELVKPGALVTVDSDNDGISAEPEEFEVVGEPDQRVVEQVIVLLGRTPGTEATITAIAGDRLAHILAEVVEEAYPEPSDGFAFNPDTIRIPNNERRYALLYVSSQVASIGNEVLVWTDNPQIQLESSKFRLRSENFRGSIAKLSIPIKGIGIGQTGTLFASLAGIQTAAQIEVVSLHQRRRGHGGLIANYDFSTQKARTRSSYDAETGTIWVYLRNPNVEQYFGDLQVGEALQLTHCQVLLAEIVLEEVAWLARQKMIESGAAMYLGQNLLQEDLDAVRKFRYEYGNLIHDWIVDDQAIARAKMQLGR